MKNYFKVIIEQYEEIEGERYPNKTEIFTQIVAEDDMTKGRYLGIIKAVNDLPAYKTE